MQNSATECDTANPDSYVLLKSVEGMMELIQTQASYYNDARKRLVDGHLKKPALSFEHTEPFYVEPEVDLALWKQKLGVLAARLKQMQIERENARRQTEAAFKQLNDENSHLREELTKLRREYMVPKDASIDEQ